MSLNWRDWPVPHHSSEAVLQEIVERFEFYDDDILVNTYPKCGTTLTQEIVSCLVLGLQATRATNLNRRSPFLDINPPPGVPLPLDEAKDLARPRVLKTHLPPAYHVRHLFADEGYTQPSARGGPLNVVVIRNPKDAAVSAFHHMTSGFKPLPEVSLNFADFWRQSLLGQLTEGGKSRVHNFFEFSLSWWSLRTHPRVLILFYEDLLRDKPNQIRRLAEFLRVELTEELLRETLDTTSFQTMRQNPHVNISLTDTQGWRPGTSFIRKGEIGDWRNHFTVADGDLVDRVAADKLAGSGLNFQFE